ncbi:hypothetical protein ACLD9W_03845 [Neisseria sp. WLZKY-1]|uniref:hypothetical protein n=1 Tax=Neisseriaceae TaxID=481 RepID=UPI0002A404AA|nr:MULTISPECIES: hypothetical protein [Neisseriaceae]EKY03045.1 hypothetical protein HMPREF9120_02817 [Neisseria sp. oral taxon 020 str. F0370]
MNKQIKICPACNQGYLYHAKPKYIPEEIILCDECDAVWLKGMKIFYGEYDKDFYSYVPFMESRGVTGESIWEGDLFEKPYYESETS